MEDSELVQRILEIGARCSALPDLDDRSPDESLGYDENGAFDCSCRDNVDEALKDVRGSL